GDPNFPLQDPTLTLWDPTFPLQDPTFPLRDPMLGLGDPTFPLEDPTFPLDVAVATHKKIDLVFHTQVFNLKQHIPNRSRDSAPLPALRQNPAAEVNDETPAHPSTIACDRPTLPRASAAGHQDHPRTPGGEQCK